MQEIFSRQGGVAGSRGMLVLGVVLFVLGLAGVLFVGKMGIIAGSGLLLMVVASWQKRNPLIRLHDDHLEMKLAIAAPRHLVLYTDIDEVTVEDGNKIRLHVHGMKIMIPLAPFEEADRRRLITALQEQQAAHGSGVANAV